MSSSEKSNSINKDTKENQVKNSTHNSEKDSNNNPNDSRTDDNYNFGWSKYSEITNGRFAMIGFASIILIELISNKSFLNWAGLIH